MRSSIITALRRLSTNIDLESHIRLIYQFAYSNEFRIRFKCTQRALHEMSRVFLSLGVGRLYVLSNDRNMTIGNITLTLGNNNESSHWRGEYANASLLGHALVKIQLARSAHLLDERSLAIIIDNIQSELTANEQATNSGTSEILHTMWDSRDQDTWAEIRFTLPITGLNEALFYHELRNPDFDASDLFTEQQWIAAAIPAITNVLRGRGISRVDIEELEDKISIKTGSGINISELDEKFQLRYHLDIINSTLKTNFSV